MRIQDDDATKIILMKYNKNIRSNNDYVLSYTVTTYFH